MTTFLEAVKELIKNQLRKVITDLEFKADVVGYNHKLSLAQRNIIVNLETKISLFTGCDDDKQNTDDLVILLTTMRDTNKKTREEEKEPGEAGNTMTCLTDLIVHTQAFYTKLTGFDFPLLNRPYTPKRPTPLGILYFHLCCYIGDDVFMPNKLANVELRSEKENIVLQRLNAASLVKEEDLGLKQQKEHVLRVLTDLSNDNKRVIKRKKLPGLPGLSFMGLSLTAPAAMAKKGGRGRLEHYIERATFKLGDLPDAIESAPPIHPALNLVTNSIFKPKAVEVLAEEKEDEETNNALVNALDDFESLVTSEVVTQSKRHTQKGKR